MEESTQYWLEKVIADPELRDKLAISNDPNDWLKALAASCVITRQRNQSYVHLANQLVMMGPIDPDPEFCDKPQGYDEFILEQLTKNDLRKKIRRVLLDELRTESDEEGYGPITLKSYARKLVDWLK